MEVATPTPSFFSRYSIDKAMEAFRPQIALVFPVRSTSVKLSHIKRYVGNGTTKFKIALSLQTGQMSHVAKQICKKRPLIVRKGGMFPLDKLHENLCLLLL